MPKKRSAGLLMYRRGGGGGGPLEVMLAHPGGPLWASKDRGVWTIPKGEYAPDEDALAAAQREFKEETGITPQAPYLPLGTITQRSGKEVAAWAFSGDCDPERIVSNDFEMEWPPRSGRRQRFPEVDRVAFFMLPEARQRINPAQAPLLDALERALSDA